MKLTEVKDTNIRIEDRIIDQDSLSFILVAMSILGVNTFKLLTTDINFNAFEANHNEVIEKLGSYSSSDSIELLMSKGMSFFPAYILTKMPSKEQKTVIVNKIADNSNTYTLGDASKAIFIAFCYLYLIGSYPMDNEYRPKILKDIYGSEFLPNTLMMDVFNCNLSKLDGRWIKLFPFSQLPEKLKNRFGISMGGTRQMGTFSNVVLKVNTPQNVVDLQLKIRSYLAKGLYWDLHPLFRTSDNINLTGSINKSLNSLTATWGTPESISILIKIKYLYETPVGQYVDSKIFSFNEDNWTKDKVNTNSNMNDTIKELVELFSQ
jgi:hypothetical protein